MRSTPAVSLACRDGGVWCVVVAGLHALAAAVVLAWLAGPGWATLGFAVSLPVALLASRCADRVAPVLGWDGEVWRLDGRPGRPTIALDLGVWLLLRVDVDAGPRHWLPVSAAAGGWSSWRAALVATAGLSPVEPDARMAG